MFKCYLREKGKLVVVTDTSTQSADYIQYKPEIALIKYIYQYAWTCDIIFLCLLILLPKYCYEILSSLQRDNKSPKSGVPNVIFW